MVCDAQDACRGPLLTVDVGRCAMAIEPPSRSVLRDTRDACDGLSLTVNVGRHVMQDE